MRYAMLICGDPAEWAAADPADGEAAMKEIYAWFEKWTAAGKIGDGGAQLEHPSKARAARSGPDGQPVVTDGPYLELKESIGGVVFIQADDLDEAMSVAATWPGLAYSTTTSVEVRPTV